MLRRPVPGNALAARDSQKRPQTSWGGHGPKYTATDPRTGRADDQAHLNSLRGFQDET